MQFIFVKTKELKQYIKDMKELWVIFKNNLWQCLFGVLFIYLSLVLSITLI